jgi:hypothetical protein
VDFDVIEAQGNPASRAIDIMRGRGDRYGSDVLDALASLKAQRMQEDIRELPLSALRVAMRFAEDVMMSSGTLLVARGYEVTASFVERAKNFRSGSVKEPVRVVARSGGKESHGSGA